MNKKLVLSIFFVFTLVFLSTLVHAQECQSDSECKSTESERRCDDNGRTCFTLTEYKCENPGTNLSDCIVSNAGKGCSICSYGCENGYCKEQVIKESLPVENLVTKPVCGNGICENEDEKTNCLQDCKIKCSQDSDCSQQIPTSNLRKYCGPKFMPSGAKQYPSEYYACTTVAKSSCQNPGTFNSQCNNAFGESCIPCTNGCKDGECISSQLQEPQPQETQFQRCTDSDNGINYYVAGCVEILNDPSLGIEGKKCDFCMGANKYLSEYVCENGIYKGDHTYQCPSGCSNGACIKGEQVTEQVKCIFENSKSEQRCYGSEEKYSCPGKDSCIIDIIGNNGEKVIWKSSCEGYAYTLTDGNNEEARFNCQIATTPTNQIAPISTNNFKNAYWQCQDKKETKQGDESSCKPAEVWKQYAEEDCKSRCKANDKDYQKCGVNSFSVYNECSSETIINPSVCGNGICESGEWETCEITATTCKEGETCKASTARCHIGCQQDCPKGKEGIYAKLNEKFKLQVSQEAKFTDYENFVIKFNDLFVPKCGSTSTIQETKETGIAQALPTKSSKVEKYSITGNVIYSPSSLIHPAKSASSSNSERCTEGYPYAVLQMKFYGLQEKTDVIKIQLGEKKKVSDTIISFLDYDKESKSGLFLVSKDDGEFKCPENCVCDIFSQIKECKKIEKCPEKQMLCPDGTCKEKCEVTNITTECKFGCFYQDKCLPYGLRINKLYCDISNDMKTQINEEEKCENNFECSSNLCIDSKCINSGIFEKFLNWFKKLYSAK